MPAAARVGSPRYRRLRIALAGSLVAALVTATNATEYRFHPSAWVDFGRIMHAEDTLTNQPSQNPILD